MRRLHIPNPRLRAPLLILCALVVALAATAGSASAGGPKDAAGAMISKTLFDAATSQPDRTFRVIVQGTRETSSGDVAANVSQELTDSPGKAAGVIRKFATVDGVAAELTGKQILKLAKKKDILAISEDARVGLTAAASSKQKWPYVSGVARFWSSPYSAMQAPTIAIVDSGVDASRADFGGRVIKQVTMTSLTPNSPGDGRGHGTFVASIAAGNGADYVGAAPTAKLVSIDVTDDYGMANTSDVIAAADWILQNKGTYGIRVANFSLHSSVASSFRFDPLDEAVERLWFSGVVVVAAAGNYAVNGQASGVLYAPGNDPFVITVGADDMSGSTGARDDFAAPWSAFGFTPDGFAKPEISAPGRYMVAAVSSNATLAQERPDRIIAPGYMQMSGTSFAAPVVSGAAAYILAAHPTWTPDQVKGALMMTPRATPEAVPNSTGVGEVNAAKAVEVSSPPDPNAALNRFLVANPNGGSLPVFDDASWTSAAQSGESWDAASWTSASWTSASWTSASWTSASWTSASWTSASWTSASWTSTSISDASWETAAESESIPAGGYWISAEELAAMQAELGIAPSP